jgi:hypothetical protein
MAGTRSSARLNSSPQSDKSAGGTKRKAEDPSPPSSIKAKRGRPSKASKEQKTLEETIPTTDANAEDEDEGIDMTDADPESKTEANGAGM